MSDVLRLFKAIKHFLNMSRGHEHRLGVLTISIFSGTVVAEDLGLRTTDLAKQNDLLGCKSQLGPSIFIQAHSARLKASTTFAVPIINVINFAQEQKRKNKVTEMQQDNGQIFDGTSN